MHLDVTELVAFYGQPLGRTARRLISARLRTLWSNVDGMTVVGHGYAVPYLSLFRGARRVIAVMPAAQGSVRWPREQPSRVALAENDQIPLPDASVDRLIAVHSIESATDPRRQLREFWRVLRAEGQLIVLVPNRRGVWARIDTTPFGSGSPYSRRQLERLLSDALFHPTGWMGALYAPPLDYGLILRSAPTYERVGATVWPGFSGVVMVEASKQLVAPISGSKVVSVSGKLETAGRGPTWRQSGIRHSSGRNTS